MRQWLTAEFRVHLHIYSDIQHTTAYTEIKIPSIIIQEIHLTYFSNFKFCYMDNYLMICNYFHMVNFVI